MKDKTCTIVIPARMGSSRLPNKPLIELAGKPLLQWVIELAQDVNFNAILIVLTEDKIIKNFVESLGVKCFLTNKLHKNGTERIIEILDKIDSEFIINLQGDEPIFPSDQLEIFIRNVIQDKTKVYTAITSIKDEKDYRNYSIPKMVFSNSKRLLYSSRAPIPGNKKDLFKKSYKL